MFSIEEMLIKPMADRTGFPIAVGKAKGNPLTGRFRIDDLQIDNPDEFPIKPFMSLVEARGQLSPTSLLSGTVQIRELFVHVRELTGIRSESGIVNIERFRTKLDRGEAVDEQTVEKHRRTLHIRHLVVKVDRIATHDFWENSPSRRDYPLNLTQEFEDVHDLISVGTALLDQCRAAGLSPAADVIFAALLPDFLWRKIRGTEPESFCQFEG